MNRLLLMFAVLVLLWGSCWAKSENPAAPPECTSEESQQFDFWLGKWEVTLVGKEDGKIADSVIEKVFSGCGVRESRMPVAGGGGESLILRTARSRNCGAEIENALQLQTGAKSIRANPKIQGSKESGVMDEAGLAKTNVGCARGNCSRGWLFASQPGEARRMDTGMEQRRLRAVAPFGGHAQ